MSALVELTQRGLVSEADATDIERCLDCLSRLYARHVLSEHALNRIIVTLAADVADEAVAHAIVELHQHMAAG